MRRPKTGTGTLITALMLAVIWSPPPATASTCGAFEVVYELALGATEMTRVSGPDDVVSVSGSVPNFQWSASPNVAGLVSFVDDSSFGVEGGDEIGGGAWLRYIDNPDRSIWINRDETMIAEVPARLSFTGGRHCAPQQATTTRVAGASTGATTRVVAVLPPPNHALALLASRPGHWLGTAEARAEALAAALTRASSAETHAAYRVVFPV